LSAEFLEAPPDWSHLAQMARALAALGRVSHVHADHWRHRDHAPRPLGVEAWPVRRLVAAEPPATERFAVLEAGVASLADVFPAPAWAVLLVFELLASAGSRAQPPPEATAGFSHRWQALPAVWR